MPLANRPRREERLEIRFADRRGHATPGVTDDEAHAFAVAAQSQRDLVPALIGQRLDRVEEDIHDHCSRRDALPVTGGTSGRSAMSFARWRRSLSTSLASARSPRRDRPVLARVIGARERAEAARDRRDAADPVLDVAELLANGRDRGVGRPVLASVRSIRCTASRA